ncbi:S-methyl thiohydantoin desulfurase domain-containing protein [Nonomuraea dietziae]|uniref:S-methyl thiohydantoin desulfurase domain-containing protein n=1 Tax=Nonomuraea dietziae TaxID=65515 RepID=UPI003F4D52A3
MEITSADVDDLAAGATLLGSSGGGDTANVASMLRHALTQHGPVPLIKAGDLAEDALVMPIAATGSITCLIERLPTGAEFAAAITAVGRHRGEPVAAAHGSQTGGANALIAVAAAAWSGLPLVDADGMGRAYPALAQVTFSTGGISAVPAVLTDPLETAWVCHPRRHRCRTAPARDAARPGRLGGHRYLPDARGRRRRPRDHRFLHRRPHFGPPPARGPTHSPLARTMLADYRADLAVHGRRPGSAPPRAPMHRRHSHHRAPQRSPAHPALGDGQRDLLTVDDGQITAHVPDDDRHADRPGLPRL